MEQGDRRQAIPLLLQLLLLLLLHPETIDRGLLVSGKVCCDCLDRVEPAVAVALILICIEVDR